MPKYVWKGADWVDPRSGEAMPIPDRGGVCAPQVVPDTPGYLSPVSGQWIDGRAARREDLRKHDCLDAGDMPTRKARDEKFARKYGLKWIGDD